MDSSDFWRHESLKLENNVGEYWKWKELPPLASLPISGDKERLSQQTASPFVNRSILASQKIVVKGHFRQLEVLEQSHLGTGQDLSWWRHSPDHNDHMNHPGAGSWTRSSGREYPSCMKKSPLSLGTMKQLDV